MKIAKVIPAILFILFLGPPGAGAKEDISPGSLVGRK